MTRTQRSIKDVSNKTMTHQRPTAMVGDNAKKAAHLAMMAFTPLDQIIGQASNRSEVVLQTQQTEAGLAEAMVGAAALRLPRLTTQCALTGCNL